MIIKCSHCRTQVNDDNGSDNDVTNGICFICWKLAQDAEWYKENDMEEVAKKIALAFTSRKIIPEAAIEKDGKEAQDCLNFMHVKLARVV